MADPLVIVPRRNFLIRALGFTAAGATLPVPIVTVDSAEKRLRHHVDKAAEALGELFSSTDLEVRASGNCLDGDHVNVLRWRAGRCPNSFPCVTLTAIPPQRVRT